MKALLVGIDARWGTTVDSVLGIRGHEQLLAADGASALDVVLRDSPALVVVEDALADMSATDFCRKVRACSEGADAVILVITNRDDGLVAVLDAGATDLYATSLGPAALETRLLIAERLVAQQAELRERERKRAEEALRTSETRYRLLFEQSPLPKFLYDFDSLRFLAVNEAAMRHYGYSHDEFLEMSLLDIWPSEDVPGFLASLDGLEPGATHSSSHRHTKKNGSVIPVDVTVHKFVLGTRPCGLAVAFDMTERNRLEGQLRQAQKMEAVGNLARGIAHDFNNLLSIILGYSNMLGEGLKPGDPLRSDLEEISQAGRRAAELTRQLLVFSCQQILEPRVLDLNVVIGGVVTMLRRLVGEDVELSVVGGAGLGAVRADSGQIEQILMNLVANSRDAMPEGGTLTIETANVELDCEFAARHPGVQPGPYVMLAVTDSGSGMDSATIARMFEPFFTTKQLGRGTGLGLATVFGVVQQSGGTIWVYSEPDAGTTIKVYLPQTDARGAIVPMPVSHAPMRRGSETILLVEDEESVRLVTRTILERHGYWVIEAQSGGDALLICEQHAAKIHVLLTDLVMPRMSGRKLAERLIPLQPDMKVLYMSRYTDDSIVRHGVLDSDVALVQKPITPETLTRKLREVIGSHGTWGPVRPTPEMLPLRLTAGPSTPGTEEANP